MTKSADAFEFIQCRIFGHLQIDAGLMDDIVARLKIGSGTIYTLSLQSGLHAMFPKSGTEPTSISSNVCEIAKRQNRGAVRSSELSKAAPDFHEWVAADENRASSSGKVLFAKAAHGEQAKRSPISIKCGVQHGLTELVLTVDIVRTIGLIDDIDQVNRFGYSPKDFIDTD